MATTIQTIEVPKKARALDTSGNNNHGQIYSGRGLEFDGVTDYLDIGAATVFSTGAWTAAFWVNIDAIGAQQNFLSTSAGTATQNISIQADGKISIHAWTGGTGWQEFDTTPNINTWYRVVISYDGSNLAFYLNGVADGTGSLNASYDSLDIRYIGAEDGDAEFFAGKMSDVQLWDAAWSATAASYDYLNPESRALNTSGTSLTESNLKLWYPMQDGHRGQQSYILDGANTGLGSELIDDGSFDTDTAENTTGTYWTTHPSWIITGGKANYDADETGKDLKQTMDSIAAGITVKIQFDILDVESAKTAYFKLECSGAPEAVFGYTTFSAGTYTYYHTITGGLDRLNFVAITSGSGGYFSIDNVSVKTINDKNHATTVFHGDELVTNGDMEVTDPTTIVIGSEAAAAADGTMDDSTAITAHAGSKSLAITGDSSSQYPRVQWLDGSDMGLVAGRTYYIECYVWLPASLNIDKVQLAVTRQAGAVYSATTTTAAWTKLSHTFVDDDITNIQIVGLEDGGSARDLTSDTFYVDSLTMKEVGVATGWTDADQQLHIPQTALQSYNQLAWFEGVDDTLTVTEFDFTTGQTINLWVNPAELDNYRSLFGQGATKNYMRYKSGSETEIIQFEPNNNIAYEMDCGAAGVIQKDKWTMYTFIWTAGRYMTVYFNGSLVGTSAQTPTDGESTGAEILKVAKFGLGYSSTTSNPFQGAMTEISHYTDVLTQAEINDLFNDGKAKSALEADGSGGLSAYWRNNGLATWDDLKGSNDGTVTCNETILLPAGVDSTRDNQGFLMNRQKDTSSLNLYDTNGVTSDLTVNNYVSFPGNPITLTNDFCVSMWIKIHRYGVGMQSIISLADDANNHFDLGMTTTRKLIGTIENSTGGMARFKQTSANADIAVDKWAHIVCCVSSGVSTGNNSATLIDSGASWPVDELIGGRVWDDTDNHGATITDNTDTVVTGVLSGSGDWDTDDKYTITKCYINTSNQTLDVAETTSAPDGTDVNNSYFIGTDNSSQKQFMGLIDNVLIYENKWLTSDEVTRNYNAGKGTHKN